MSHDEGFGPFKLLLGLNNKVQLGVKKKFQVTKQLTVVLTPLLLGSNQLEGESMKSVQKIEKEKKLRKCLKLLMKYCVHLERGKVRFHWRELS